MKSYFKLIVLTLIIAVASCKEQEQNVEKTLEAHKVNIADEEAAVITVLKNYKDAIQNLTTEGTTDLFTKNATVFESGGSEGTYTNYLAHHLGPELDHFNSFVFSDYTATVVVDMPYAFTTETYIYTIKIKANKERGVETRTIIKKGVATSILKKIDEKWKIIKTHSSSRNVKKH